MIIDRPCVSCGLSLERGVITVFVWDIIKASLSIIISSLLLVPYLNEPKTTIVAKKPIIHAKNISTNAAAVNNSIKSYTEVWYYEYDLFWIFCAVILFSIIEIVLAFVLYYSVVKKSVSILHTWLILTGLSLPLALCLFLIKIYEMIVVFAYAEELTCEAGGKALEEFRKLPYTCYIKTQLYPTPLHGSPSSRSGSASSHHQDNMKRRSMIYLSEKNFLMNVNTSVFAVVRHQQR